MNTASHGRGLRRIAIAMLLTTALVAGPVGGAFAAETPAAPKPPATSCAPR